jgi:murein DD-endopeptidase MepM/ murein hydrolase activator NlpD
MGAPVTAAAALARSRTGRRVVVGFVAALITLALLLLSPLWLIPLAVAGDASTTADDAGAGKIPRTSGVWGEPLAPGWTTGRGFGWHPVKGCAYCPSDHEGIDLASGCGQTVFAAAAGRVVDAGAMPGWGNTVRIDHGDGIVTLYGHMQWHSLIVAAGDDVDVGTPIGLEGSTGKSTGCHLHFEVQIDGVAIDPEPFMTALGLPLR